MATNGKVVLVLSDGLRYDTAVASMGFLGHLVEARASSLYKVRGELPSLSRPMYETVHTGLPVSAHGVVSNQVVRLSNKPNIFGLVVAAGRTTAAAAYSWFSELYNASPYDRVEDREVTAGKGAIQYARFYTEDDYPDTELFTDAAMLIRRHRPDYMLIHPMGMDFAGETYGSDSEQYRYQALKQDVLLANLVGEWLALGYSVLVTADHGMNTDGHHGGTVDEVRDVPLFVISSTVAGKGDTGTLVSQLQIAPTVLSLLGVAVPPGMPAEPIGLY